MKVFENWKTSLLVAAAMLVVVSAEAHPKNYRHSHSHGRALNSAEVVVVNAPARGWSRAAIGEVIDSLPRSFVRVEFGGRQYFVKDGVYFQRHNRGYVRVQPIVGMRVAALPAGFVTVKVNGATRYRFAGVTYRRVNNYFVVV